MLHEIYIKEKKAKKKNHKHKCWYKSKHLFRMRKILQQITVVIVVLEIQIIFWCLSKEFIRNI